MGFEDIKYDDFTEGMKTVFNNEMGKISPKKSIDIFNNYVLLLRGEMLQKNADEGQAFLEKNKENPKITELESGLQYEILEEGKGGKPGPTSQVTVHYHGTLIDGTVFDSSVQRGAPATFGVNQVIRGWTEALQLMSEGAKYRLSIPQELAYGANPHPGGAIQPYAALIFDVELISIA
mgnify:CR=1 FL=1